MIFVIFLHGCNVSFFRNNWFAPPLMLGINIFLYVAFFPHAVGFYSTILHNVLSRNILVKIESIQNKVKIHHHFRLNQTQSKCIFTTNKQTNLLPVYTIKHSIKSIQWLDIFSSPSHNRSRQIYYWRFNGKPIVYPFNILHSFRFVNIQSVSKRRKIKFCWKL